MDIIIPTWNNSDLTIQCLLALKKGTEPGYRIIWIDNGSEPKHRTMVQDWMTFQRQPFMPIFFDENLGFSKAINRGLAMALMAQGPEIILLNNDVQVTPGWLEKFTSYAEAHPKIGILGCLTNSGAVQSYKRYWGPRPNPEKFINGLDPLATRITGGCVPFSCVLLKRAMIDQVGLLDEDFSPCLGEDDDYCDRARLGGWRTEILLSLFVYHDHRRTVELLPNWQALQADHRNLLLKKMAARRKPK